VREALEAFGYYRPTIDVSLDTSEEGVYRLGVRVDAGEPVRLTKVQVQVAGSRGLREGADEKAADFPLHAGDVLRHDIYGAVLSHVFCPLGKFDATIHAPRVLFQMIW